MKIKNNERKKKEEKMYVCMYVCIKEWNKKEREKVRKFGDKKKIVIERKKNSDH